MDAATVEISIAGKWFRVPALEVDGTTVAIKGTWLKIATIYDEDCQENELLDPESCIRQLKAGSSHRVDILTFTQKPTESAKKYNYFSEWESVAVVGTDNYNAWWEGVPQETRKNVRRGEKRGVVVVIKKLDEGLIRDIVQLNNDSHLRQGKRFVHYGKSFDQVKNDQMPYIDRSDYVCTYFGEELIGFIKLIYRGEVASIIQILPKASHQDKRPANILIAAAIRLCESRGVKYLTYGMFNYGNKTDSSLREFKTRVGFREKLVPRYYVPISRWGRLCIALNLHRGILNIVPKWFIDSAIAVRTCWYKRFSRAGVAQR